MVTKPDSRVGHNNIVYYRRAVCFIDHMFTMAFTSNL